MTATTQNTARSFSIRKAITSGAIGAGVAAVVLVIYGGIVNATVGPAMAPLPPDQQLGAIPWIAYGMATLSFYIPAIIAWVITLRFSGANGIRNYTIVAGVGLLVSFVPLLDPTMTMTSKLILGVAHVLAAAVGVSVMFRMIQR